MFGIFVELKRLVSVWLLASLNPASLFKWFLTLIVWIGTRLNSCIQLNR